MEAGNMCACQSTSSSRTIARVQFRPASAGILLVEKHRDLRFGRIVHCKEI
jgi:hypothetical protein